MFLALAKAGWRFWVAAGIILAVAGFAFTRPTALTVTQAGVNQIAWGMGGAVTLIPGAIQNFTEGTGGKGSIAIPQPKASSTAKPKQPAASASPR